jgi:ABC-type Fe3+/spermidine/putrescine transport system ATPase subunit
MAYGLKNHKVPQGETKDRIENALEMLELGGLDERYPRQLSGGQQQRVALARVLVIQPKIMLFDEPLSNLDAKLRLQMRVEIRALQKKVNITSIFVTHDQEEALTIADRVVVMHEGGIEQIGAPAEIYDMPRTRFMADFVGISNIFKGSIVGETNTAIAHFRSSHGTEIFVERPRSYISMETVRIAVRPENMTIVPQPPEPVNAKTTENRVPAIIENTLRMGPITQYNVRFEAGDKAIVHRQYRSNETTYLEGEKVWVLWPPESCLCLKE